MIFQRSVCKFKNLLKRQDIIHFVSTRNDGVSPPPYKSLNLSFRSNDSYENVLRNRSTLLKSLKIPIENVTLGKQTHSGNVSIVNDVNKGFGADCYDSAIPNSDALVTNVQDICLMVLLADCVPILFFDPCKKVVAIAHAGRVGVENKIAVNTAMVLINHFHCSPENVLVGIGPAISKEHYNISQDATLKLKNVLPPQSKSLHCYQGVTKADLALANKEQLIGVGIQENNIEMSNLCTYSLSADFFSERRDGKPTGRFGAGIMLLQNNK